MTPQELEFLAQACHEANRVYCLALGDFSQPYWETAPEWQKNSAKNGVKLVLSGSSPEKQHQNWMKNKLQDGWKYGPIKDLEKKEHPCLVPYEELPEEQRTKNKIFIETVLTFAKYLP